MSGEEPTLPPGEAAEDHKREREAEEQRRLEGIPLLGPVVEDLRAVARDTGVPFE